MLADHWDKLGRRNVVPWRPVVLPIGSVEVFLDDLLPPRQPVSTAHGRSLWQISPSSSGRATFRIRYTCAADHSRPRAVTIPRRFRPSAMSRKLVAPSNLITLITGRRSFARRCDCARRTSGCSISLPPDEVGIAAISAKYRSYRVLGSGVWRNISMIRTIPMSQEAAFAECTKIASRLDATPDATRAAAERLTSGF
jgi:hypothetical protein